MPEPCVPLDQAREAIAVLLAAQATTGLPASPYQHPGSAVTGDEFAEVNGTTIVTWVYPGEEAALCFTPHTRSRHVVQTAPLPAWITSAGQALFALPLLAAAIAGCCERTRYASLSGAIAVPVSTALIALAEFTPALQRHLLTPPATPQAAATAWYALAAAALCLAGIAIRDQWHRYTHRLHRRLGYTRR